MLVYPAGVDLSTSALRFLARELTARRLAQGTRWRRLAAGRQALLVLAHLRCGHTYAQLAAGFGVGTTTAYRYIAEAVDILAALAPTLAEAVRTASGKAFVILDGTLLPIDRIAADRPFYSGQHKKHGMNVQVIADPAGRLLWASPRAAGICPRHQGRANPRHHRCPGGGRGGLLGRQGLPGRRRHRASSLLGALGDSLPWSAGRQLLTREDPCTRRTGHGHPQNLAAHAQTAMLYQPHHQPRPGRPHPAPDMHKLRLEKAH